MNNMRCVGSNTKTPVRRPSGGNTKLVPGVGDAAKNTAGTRRDYGSAVRGNDDTPRSSMSFRAGKQDGYR